MKYIFCTVLFCLIVASVITAITLPDRKSDVPVIYWVTDANPARHEQIRKFHKWLVKHGFTKPDDPTRPVCEVRLDTANRNIEKQVIQGVSGVGGDVMDVSSGGGTHVQFDQIGLLEDITEAARGGQGGVVSKTTGETLLFDSSQTYPGIQSDLSVTAVDGTSHQVMFPCNVAVSMIWVNVDTFEKYGLKPPPRRWTFEEFEELGKEFSNRANSGKDIRDAYIIDGVKTLVLMRSLGVSHLNETLTASRCNNPQYVRVLKLVKRWMDMDIIPTDSDKRAFSAESGYGGSTLQLFNSGNYATFGGRGRYALIQLRQFNRDRQKAGQRPLRLAVVEFPHGGYPNTTTGTRAAAVYAGGKNKQYAKLFQAFLASEEYNMQIVDDADSLPPNPKYTKTEKYLRPKKYPNEWGCHEVFSESAETIAIGGVWSPFMPPESKNRIIKEGEEEFVNGQVTAEEAVRIIEERINNEIAQTLRERPALKADYDRRLTLQKAIDERVAALKEVEALEKAGKPVPAALKARARKIPLTWISNVFYRKYYTDKGWTE